MAKTSFKDEVTRAAIRLLYQANGECPACGAIVTGYVDHALDCLELREQAVDVADVADTMKRRKRR